MSATCCSAVTAAGPLARLLVLLMLTALLGAFNPALAGGTTWRAPVAGQLQVLRPFEKPAAPWAPGHRGLDLALEAGGDVLAPAAGEVTFAGVVVDRQVLTLRHPDGKLSSFEPVTDPLPVGSQVAAGQVIAQLDEQIRHCPQGPCLHWGVREPLAPGPGKKKLDYINPLLLLGLAEPSVLLPIGDDFGA